MRDQDTPSKVDQIKAGRAQAIWKSLLFVLTTTEAIVATVCGASGVLRFRLLYRLESTSDTPTFVPAERTIATNL